MGRKIEVFGWGGAHLGFADSFPQAKQMQRDSLPDDLKDAYAGWVDGYPGFYRAELTADLLAKYPELDRAPTD